MLATAAILSIVLFLMFASSGIQKVRYTHTMAQSAEHLGFKKMSWQRIGVLEIAGGIGLMAGLSAKTGFWAILNEAAAAGLLLTMVLAIYFHIKKGDNIKFFAPAAVLALLSALELIFRLVH